MPLPFLLFASVLSWIPYLPAMEKEEAEKSHPEKRSREESARLSALEERETKRPRIEDLSNEPLSLEEEQQLQASLKKLGATGDFAIPTTDSGFKHLLAYEQGNEDIIISFLNTFVPPFHSNPVTNVSPAPTAIPALPYKGLKQTFMDMHVIAQDGTHYVIEMQAERHIHFDERALFYACATYAHQIEEKAFLDKTWYKSLKPVIGIQVLDYATNKIRGIKNEGIDDTLVQRVKDHPLPADQFIKHYLMQCQRSGQQLDHLQLIQIELGQVKKDLFPPNKEFTDIDWWLSTFKYASQYTEGLLKDLEKQGIIMPPVIKKAFERLKYSKWNPKEKREYKNDVGDKEQNKILLAVERAEGKEEGIKIGKEIGKEIGKKEGEQAKAKEIALNMLLKGMSEKDIMTLTKLSMAEIETLKKQQ